LITDYRVFIAVRMKSTRLKRKALLNLGGRPVIGVLIDRLSEKIQRENIIICTSDLESDNELEKLSKSYGINCFRGDPDDVMKRFINAEKIFPARNIVRVTGDNPLTDPNLLLKMLYYHDCNENDYTWTNSFPIGTRPEVIRTKTINTVHQNLIAPENSEYMSYMLNRPDKLKVGCYEAEDKELTFPSASVTLDTPEDYENLKHLFKSTNNDIPNMNEILQWCDTNSIQKNCVQIASVSVDNKLYGFKDDF
jgi:spore coat polysaccharide biosynthesis protein SpsF